MPIFTARHFATAARNDLLDKAERERDEAKRERDEAKGKLDKAERERDEAKSKLEKAKGKLDELTEKRERGGSVDDALFARANDAVKDARADVERAVDYFNRADDNFKTANALLLPVANGAFLCRVISIFFWLDLRRCFFEDVDASNKRAHTEGE